MNNYGLTIIDLNGNLAVIDKDGYIVKTEQYTNKPYNLALLNIIEWLREKFASQDFGVDFSRPLRDIEHETYTTENRLKREFLDDAEKQEEYGNFNAWMHEITGKNGIMEFI